MSEDISKNKSQDPDYEYDTVTNVRLIKDHEYDGIYELDNDLPPWWKWLFYISIFFGVIYLVRLFFFNAPDLVQEQEYLEEMAQAKSAAPEAADFKLIVLNDETSLNAGKEIWVSNCAVCHLPTGAGIVGPNITDDYWIHGNTLEEMFKVVEIGVIEKGMIPYKDILSPTQRLQVISYMISLHGSNPENPKEAQGELLAWPY